MGKNKFLQFVPEAVARSGAPLPGVPLVEVCNSRRVLIENHQGVIAYQSNEIVIKIRSGNICICGDCLQLIKMSKCQLVITGVVTAVYFREKG